MTAVISLPLVSGEMHPVTQEAIEHWHEVYPGVDIAAELRRMLGWLEANPKQRKTKNGIARFINSWLDREQNRNRASPVTQGKQQALSQLQTRKTFAEMDEERTRAEFLRMTNSPDWKKQMVGGSHD